MLTFDNYLEERSMLARVKSILDRNGDGKINTDDLPDGAKKLGKVMAASAVAAGVTAAGAAAAGSAIVGSTASAIGAGAATAAGVVAGLGLGAGTGAAYTAVKAMQITKAATYIGVAAGDAVYLKTGSDLAAIFAFEAVKAGAIKQMALQAAPQVASTISAIKTSTAAVGGGVGFVSELVAGEIAGLPIVKAVATNVALARGEVFVIGGIAFSTKAAIALGLISVIVIAGYAYYVYNGKKGKAKIKRGKPDVDLQSTKRSRR